LVHATLDNREQRLSIAVFRPCAIKPVNATFQPPVGPLHGLLGIAIITGIGGAFIKCHDNIRPDYPMDIHHIFWSKMMLCAANMRTNYYSLFGNLSVFFHGKNLITATVGQNRPWPAVELMQAPRLLQDIQSRPQV